MKSKRLFQVFVLLAMLFSNLGTSQLALASGNSGADTNALIINRDLTYWDATYIGFVSSNLYENWQLVLTESHNFAVTANPVTSDFDPLLILLDTNGMELARGSGTLTSTQSAGNYFIQVQPESGSGFYILTLEQINQSQPSVSTVVTPASVNVGETAVVTVNLNSVPAEGYTSAEFTCTYDASLVEVSNIVLTGLFGTDAAAATHGPQNGSFIVAVAGSNGNKATTSGNAFTFSAEGLQAGQSAIDCQARVSQGDNVLTSLSSTPASLTVLGGTATPTPSSTPIVSTPTPTLEPTAGPSPTPTSIPTNSAVLTGQVMASKPVTVNLYNAGNSPAGSVTANADGTFSLTVPAGTYTVIATASGFLNAQGTTVLTAGASSAMPTVSLLAGDIDGNSVIDQFDAMTIGMSYNTAVPTAADLNNDGTINVLDLELLAKNYRKAGALAWQ